MIRSIRARALGRNRGRPQGGVRRGVVVADGHSVSEYGATVSDVTNGHERAVQTYHNGGGTTLVIGNGGILVQVGIAFDVGLVTGLFEFVWRQDGPMGGIVERGPTMFGMVFVVMVVVMVVMVGMRCLGWWWL